MNLQTINLGSDRFTEWKLIGVGGQSEVYSAFDSILKRQVAIKVRRIPESDRVQKIESLNRLHRQLVNLKHPAIVQLLDIIQINEVFATIETLCTGGTLESKIENQHVDRQVAIVWFAKIVEAVQYLHNHGLLHSDLKLANVVLDDREQPHLIDFDFVQPIGGKPVGQSTIRGTPAYMAPELTVEGGAATVATEVYALGIMLYELLCNVSLSKSRNTQGLRELTFGASFYDSFRNRSDAADLEAIVRQATNSDPGNRYKTCLDLLLDVQHAFSNKAISARRKTRLEKSLSYIGTNPLQSGLVGATLAIMILGSSMAAVAWWRAQNLQSRAEQSTRTLQENISKLNAAREKLGNLIKEVQVENQAARQAEQAQVQLSEQAMQARDQTKLAATEVANLTTAAQEALSRVGESALSLKSAVAEKSKESTRFQESELRADELQYLSKFRQAWELVKQSKWQEAQQVADGLQADYRGVEFQMLLGAIRNRSDSPQAVDLGSVRAAQVGSISQYGNLSAICGEGKASRRVSAFKTGGKVPAFSWTISQPLGSQEALYRSNITDNVLAILKDGSVLVDKQSFPKTLCILTFQPENYNHITLDSIQSTIWQPDGRISVQKIKEMISGTSDATKTLGAYELQKISEVIWDGLSFQPLLLGGVKMVYGDFDPVPYSKLSGQIAISPTGLFGAASNGPANFADPLSHRTLKVNANAGLITFDSKGRAYLSSTAYVTNPLYKLEVSKDSTGLLVSSPKQLLLKNIGPSCGLCIPNSWDEKHLYVTQHGNISRYQLPVEENSRKQNWFQQTAPGSILESTLLSKDRFIIRYYDTSSKRNSYILYDRKSRGLFTIQSNLSGPICLSPDGKTMYQFVDCHLIPFSLEPVSCSLVPEIIQKDYWQFWPHNGAKGEVVHGESETSIKITASSTEDWHLQIYSRKICLVHEKEYRATVTARSSGKAHFMLRTTLSDADFSATGLDQKVQLTQDYQQFEFKFKANNPMGRGSRFGIEFGTTKGEFEINNIELFAD